MRRWTWRSRCAGRAPAAGTGCGTLAPRPLRLRLNADNLGGLHNSRIVQLWNCYPAGNESWDFGDWHRAVSAGGRAYPLFVRSGRLCLDADKYDLRVGTPVRIWAQYAVANQFWS